jgi:hypothetical protein
MAVAVVAENVTDLHLRAVDLAVLRVGDLHLEGHLVAEAERLTVARQLELHLRRGVAHGDDHAGAAGTAAGVGHGHGRRVGAVLGVLMGGVRLLGGGAVAEVPLVRELVAVGVAAAV